MSLMKKKLLGMFLVMLTNICYICSNYLVKWAHLGPGELSLVRGIVQTCMFSLVIFWKGRKSRGVKTFYFQPILYFYFSSGS